MSIFTGAFTCGFCGVLLGLETSDDPWLFFGIGIWLVLLY